MKKLLLVTMITVLLVGSVWAIPDRHPMVNHDRISDADFEIPANAPRPTPLPNELDEIVGDTMYVGWSWWDAQHNGTVGRMVGFAPDSGRARMVWTKLYEEAGSSARHVHHNMVFESNGVMVRANNGQNAVEQMARAGYTTVGIDPVNDGFYPNFHSTASTGGDYSSTLSSESPWVPGFFESVMYPIPANETEVLWPKGAFGQTGHMHSVSTANREDNAAPQGIYYMRYYKDPVSGWTAATGDGEQEQVTALGMNISSDISVSGDGQKVAIVQTMGRENTIGEVYSDGGTQHNNDIWLWQSMDAGATWDWNSYTNVTNWIGPDEALLPDTAKAQRDTMRAYTDGSVIYDDLDNAHVAFSAENSYLIEGLISFGSRIYHWDEVNQVKTMIHDGHVGFIGGVEAWGRTADRPSLYFDNDTGILWCVFQRASNSESNPDTTDFFDSASRFTARDIHVAASPPGPYNGLLWTKSVNITRTIYTGTEPGQPGDYMSEQDPSVALNSDGDYLHITYLLDGMPGISIGTAPDTDPSLNPFIYHRVLKSALIDSFEAQAEWVENYPMHVSELDENGNETGVHQDHWVDPAGYNWGDYGGFFSIEDRTVSVDDGSMGLQPGEFELEANYPNPFNPTTQIAFNLQRRGHVELAVYDVLGRQVAELVNRPMNSGRHTVTFFASDLPSGVYFYKLNSGEASQVRKMVLMK